jgi:hypothetical protein
VRPGAGSKGRCAWTVDAVEHGRQLLKQIFERHAVVRVSGVEILGVLD